jgi:hypothetical protein
MANRPAPIRKAEIERAVKGVLATGLNITRIDVEGGKIIIHTGDSESHEETPLEAWRRRENGQS